MAYLPHLWRRVSISSRGSRRFLKFLVVGGIGVFVNLMAMAAIIRVTGCRDWRASAAASLVAALHNYFLNNGWTFHDRRRSGRALFNGVFLYLPMSAAGIATTAVVFSFLSGPRFHANPGTSSSFHLLEIQLVSILFGTYLNYSLNKLFTWRRSTPNAAAECPARNAPAVIDAVFERSALTAKDAKLNTFEV